MNHRALFSGVSRFVALATASLCALAGGSAFAAAASAPAMAPPPPPAFGRFDVGFSGVFEDLLLNRLALERSPAGYAGELSYVLPWKITAKAVGETLVGVADAGVQRREFRARRDGETIEVTLGSETLRLFRTAALDPQLADLGAPRPDARRRWTIAVYLDGDNNLEQAALDDFAEMRRAMPAEGVELLVLFDRAKGWSDEDGDWTGTRLYRVRPGGAAPELVRELGELNMGDAGTLGGFLTGVFRTFPAEHHAAFLWNHGSGWGGIADDEDAPGYEGGRCALDLRDIRTGLRTAYFHAVHQRLDLVAFDACLMAQLEVALQVSDLADFFTGSEASVPSEGYPYDRVLPLFGDAAKSPRDVAGGLAEAFAAAYVELKNPDTTIAAIDLAHVAGVAAALDRFAAKCLPAVEQQWPAFSRALFYGESYEARALRTKEGKRPSLDLADLLGRLEQGLQPFPAAAELAELRAALGRAVIVSRNGDLRRLSRGLAIYAPRFASQQSDQYAIAPLARANRWTDLIRRVHTLAAAGAKKPVKFDELSVYARTRDGKPVVRPLDGDRLQFTLDGQGVVQVVQFDAVKDGDVWAVLRKTWVPDATWMTRWRKGVATLEDLFMPQFNDGRTALFAELNGVRFMAGGDAKMVNLTLNSVTERFDAPYTARALLRRVGAKAPVEVEVHFDYAWWRAESVYELSNDPKVAPRLVRPRPDDEFSFLIETYDAAEQPGRIESEPVAWGQGLMLIPMVDDPGDYRSYLVAMTMDGRATESSIDYAVEENPVVTAWMESWKEWKPSDMTGTWQRQLADADGKWHDIPANARFKGSLPGHPGVLLVQSDFDNAGQPDTAPQTWLFDTRGLPTLRILQELENDPKDGSRTLCWWGPIGWEKDGDEGALTMKALQVGGVLWRWRYDFLESLKIPRDRIRKTPPGEAKK